MNTSYSRWRGWFLAMLVLLLVCLAACSNSGTSGETSSNQTSDSTTIPESPALSPSPPLTNIPKTQEQEPDEEVPPLPQGPTSMTLLAVGDIMMHSPQFPAYLDKKTGLYDFTSYFTDVKPYIEEADLAWGNLETPLLGGEKTYTGYPMFNAPAELADALKWAGFDILTSANNHALDRRAKGVVKTLEVLKERELITRGIYASLWQSKQSTIVESNGIKLGILAYTYGTNGIPLPKNQPYMVDLIDEEKILADIKKTRQDGADVVAIALHFGNEYERVPSNEQKKLARSLAAGGADIILGSHPHVLQPYERIRVETKDGQSRDALIMYSLGNFISNQRGDYKDIGCMFRITIEKDASGQIQLKETIITPTWVIRTGGSGKYNYEIVPLTAEVMQQDKDRWSSDQLVMLEKMLTQTDQHLHSMTEIPVIQATQ